MLTPVIASGLPTQLSLTPAWSRHEQESLTIRSILTRALTTRVLTAQQEHCIALLLHRNACTQADLQALDALMAALRSDRVRYAPARLTRTGL
jgi:hypothetical protein